MRPPNTCVKLSFLNGMTNIQIHPNIKVANPNFKYQWTKSKLGKLNKYTMYFNLFFILSLNQHGWRRNLSLSLSLSLSL